MSARDSLIAALRQDVRDFPTGEISVPSCEIAELLDRLDFALGVIDDHDLDNPDARLRLDYETRVEEAITEARAQAMEP